MTFREFATEQINRLKSFAEFAQKVPEDGQREIRRWMEERSGCDPKAEAKSRDEWLIKSEGARRVKAVIDDCLSYNNFPDLRTMRSVWASLYPDIGVTHANCPECNGTGWKIVERNGVEGAARCIR